MPALFHRRVLRIRAEDSPPVRREMARRRGDPEDAWPPETPGVLGWNEYQRRRATWDTPRQTIGLDATHYEGASVLMFPPDWLARSQRLADSLRGRPRRARAIGIDPAEGGDSTVWAVVDEYGLIHMLSLKTPDTNVIVGQTLALMREYGVRAESVVFDAGGGGKQHADRMRAMGHQVRAVGFGESVSPPPRLGVALLEDRQDERESRYTYYNRRAQMYGTLRQLLDPAGVPGGGGEPGVGRSEAWDAVAAVTGSSLRDVKGFAIPAEYAELRRQLAPIPLTYNGEGRLYLLPKNKRDPKSNQKTLTELIGCSPDHADSLALACHGLTTQTFRPYAGGLW